MESHTPLAKEPSNSHSKNITVCEDYSFDVKIAAMDEDEDEDYYWSDNEWNKLLIGRTFSSSDGINVCRHQAGFVWSVDKLACVKTAIFK